MHKLLLILSLSLVASHATAEWTMIQTNDNGNMYIDFDTLKKSGDLVQVTTLNDYYSVQQKQELSSQWRELHDCKSKKFKALAIDYFSENMAKGRIIEAVNLPEADTAWAELTLYSVGELKANIICSK